MPRQVRAGIMPALLAVLLAGCATVQGSGTGSPSGISGKVSLGDGGAPVDKAFVYAYVGRIESRAAALGIIGLTDWVSHGSGTDGTYKLDLPPGEYYVVARKRSSGANFGPLSRGDLYDHRHTAQTIRVRAGQYTPCDFHLQTLNEPLFFQGLTAREKQTTTGIRGRLLDEGGKSVPGTFVIAYKDGDMRRLPDFASTLTDDEGYYVLYLPQGGKYYLAARFYAMRVPEKGEPFAKYEGTADHSVEVTDGKFVEGIDMTLRPYQGQAPKGYDPLR